MDVLVTSRVRMSLTFLFLVVALGLNVYKCSSVSTMVESKRTDTGNTIESTLIRRRRQASDMNDQNETNASAFPYGKTIVTLEEYLLNITEPTLQKHTRSILQLCPHVDLCEYVIKGSWKERDQCCLQCNCDEACGITGSCCPHFQQELFRHNVTLDKALACKTSIMLDRFLAVPLNEYLFVNTCPRRTGIRLKEACERVVHNETFILDDVTPVTDKTIPRNYQNRHCAACHNIPVDNLVMWSPDIRCLSPLFKNSETSSIEDAVLYQKDCSMLFQPPDVKDINSTLCSSNVISKCNVTGKWVTGDEQLEAACNELLFRHRVHGEHTGFNTYRNIFCALCNGEQLNAAGGGNGCRYGETESLFTLLVWLEVPKPNIDKNNGVDCGNGGLFDPITGQCRVPVCSKPTMLNLNDFTCRNVVDRISKGVYVLNFKIVPYGGHHTQLPSPDKLKDAVLDVLYWSEVVTLCPIKFLLKLNQTFQEIVELKSLILITELPVKEIFLTAHASLIAMRDPNRELNRIISEVTSYKLVLGTSIWSIMYPAQIDDLIHLGVVTEQPAHALPTSTTPWETSLTVFEDLYDNMAIIRGLNFLDWFDGDCDPYIIQTIGFLNCCAFVYNIVNDGFERVVDGLMLPGKTTFVFGEFQSINASHVAICAGVVRERITMTGGCTVIGTCSIFSIVMTSIVCMLLFHS